MNIDYSKYSFDWNSRNNRYEAWYDGKLIAYGEQVEARTNALRWLESTLTDSLDNKPGSMIEAVTKATEEYYANMEEGGQMVKIWTTVWSPEANCWEIFRHNVLMDRCMSLHKAQQRMEEMKAEYDDFPEPTAEVDKTTPDEEDTKDCHSCAYASLDDHDVPCDRCCSYDHWQAPLGSPEPNTIETEDPLSQQVGGNHYKDFKIQPFEFFHANQLPFHKSDIIKRIMRYDLPTGKGLEDLQKIQHEINMIIELEGYAK